VTADKAELGRYPDAAEARAAARKLLAVGITPEVARDGDEHVLLVDAAAAGAGAATLEIVPPEGPPPRTGDPDADPDDWGRPGTSSGSIFDPPPSPGGAAVSPSLPPPPAPVEAIESDGPQVDDQGFVVVAVRPNESAAHEVAATLLEHGIGVELGSAVETGYASPLMGTGDGLVVRVLELDVERALAILGTEPPRRLTQPQPRAEPTPDEAATDSVDVAAPPLRPRRGGGEKPEEIREYFGGRLRLTKRQLWTGIIVYLAALILIPLFFFFLTRWALDPGGGDPTDTIPGFTTTTVD
jgi:hypothetical protein